MPGPREPVLQHYAVRCQYPSGRVWYEGYYTFSLAMLAAKNKRARGEGQYTVIVARFRAGHEIHFKRWWHLCKLASKADTRYHRQQYSLACTCKPEGAERNT